MLPCSPHRPRRRGDRQTRALTDARQNGFRHYAPSDLSRTDCFPDHKPIHRHSRNARHVIPATHATSFQQRTHVIPAKAGIQRPNIRGVLSAYPRHDKSSETFVWITGRLPQTVNLSRRHARGTMPFLRPYCPQTVSPSIVIPATHPRHSSNTPTSFQRRRESSGLPGCIRVPVSLGDDNRGSTKLGGGSH